TRHVEELMAERGVELDHATINRWVIKYSPQLEANWRDCSKRNGAGVVTVDCSSNMTTESRWTISMAITAIRAMQICKRSMDTAIMRKRGNIKIISREVCVTKHQDTEERRERKQSCADLEQRQAERSVCRL